MLIFDDQNDFVLIFHLGDNSAIFNLELTSAGHCDDFYEFITHSSKKEILIMSQSKKIFENKKLIGLFGDIEYSQSSNYIAFQSSNIFNEINASDRHIRTLTLEDIDVVHNFTSNPNSALKRSFDSYIVDKSYEGKIYGYFIDNNLCAYLLVNSVDGVFWDVEYIYTLEKHRGQKIGTNLAKFYLNDVIGKGGIASYGSAENEASAKVAENAGFQSYDITYCSGWLILP
jgi:Acetyltransferase (GNAT) family.